MPGAGAIIRSVGKAASETGIGISKASTPVDEYACHPRPASGAPLTPDSQGQARGPARPRAGQRPGPAGEQHPGGEPDEQFGPGSCESRNMASPRPGGERGPPPRTAPLPHSADPQRSGRVNSTRMMRTESRKIPSLPPPAGPAPEPVAVPAGGPEPDQEPRDRDDGPGNGEVHRRLAAPRIPTRRSPQRSRRSPRTPCSRPPRGGHPCLGLILLRPPAAWSAYWSSAPPP